MPTIGRGRKVDLVTNWNDKLRGNYIKLILDDKESVLIPTSSFLKLALLLSKEEDKDKFVQVRQIPVRQFKKTVTITLAKDFRQGSKISIPVEFNIPTKDLLSVIAEN